MPSGSRGAVSALAGVFGPNVLIHRGVLQVPHHTDLGRVGPGGDDGVYGLLDPLNAGAVLLPGPAEPYALLASSAITQACACLPSSRNDSISDGLRRVVLGEIPGFGLGERVESIAGCGDEVGLDNFDCLVNSSRPGPPAAAPS